MSIRRLEKSGKVFIIVYIIQEEICYVKFRAEPALMIRESFAVFALGAKAVLLIRFAQQATGSSILGALPFVICHFRLPAP